MQWSGWAVSVRSVHINDDKRTEMGPHFLGLVVGVAPPQLGVVVGVRRHAQQVQAVQLVEHLQADTVAGLARLGVCDLHGVVGHLELGEVGLGDHLVGDCAV